MEVDVVTSERALSSLFGEWRSLQLRAGQWLFTDPAFFGAWWDIQGRARGQTLHLVTGRDQGRLVALAPLVIAQRYGLRVLEWPGAGVLDYSNVILDREADCDEIWRAVRRSRRYDLAFLRSVRFDSSCRRTIADFGHLTRAKTLYYVSNDWPSGEAWFNQQLSAKKRKRLRHIERQLADDQGLSFNVHTAGQAPEAVMRTMVEQKTAWATRYGKAGLFDDPSSAAALLTRFAEAAGELGNLHLSWLSRGEQIIAVHLGFVHRNVLYYYMPSYDIAWSRCSPGSLLLAKLVAWCSDSKLAGLDFMQGTDPYKASFANSRVTVEDFSFARSTRGWAAELAARKLFFRRSLS